VITQILTILDGGDHMNDGFGMMGGFGGGWWMWIMIIGGILIVPLLAIWTYQDAQQFGENAALWALVVFITMGTGIILYFVLRNSNRSNLVIAPTPSPSRPSQKTSSTKIEYSPSTPGSPQIKWETQGGFCVNCGATIEVNDNFCQECGTPLGNT
jgi:hypothetical protein